MPTSADMLEPVTAPEHGKPPAPAAWAVLAAGIALLAVAYTQAPGTGPIGMWTGLAAQSLLAVSGGMLLPAVVGRRAATTCFGALAAMAAGASVLPSLGRLSDGSLLLAVFFEHRMASLLFRGVALTAAATIAWRQRLYQRDDLTRTSIAATATVAAVAAILLFWWSNAAGLAGISIQRISLDVAVLLAAVAAFGATHRRTAAAIAIVVVVIDPTVFLLAPFNGHLLAAVVQTAEVAATIAVPLLLARWVASRQFTTDDMSDIALLVVANVLNIVDAVFTWFLLDSGTGEEMNPVIDIIGLPGKIVLVGIGTYVLYRLRPASLRWAIIPLAAITAYHVMGVLFVGL